MLPKVILLHTCQPTQRPEIKEIGKFYACRFIRSYNQIVTVLLYRCCGLPFTTTPLVVSLQFETSFAISEVDEGIKKKTHNI